MPRPLRLLVFSHSGAFGGSEQLLLQLVRELAGDRDTECTVVVPAEGLLTEALRTSGLNTWIWPTSWWCELGSSDAARARRTLAAGALEVLRNLGDARSFDPDAVLSITTVIPWGGLTAVLLGKPHLWYITDFGGMSLDPPEYYVPFREIRRALLGGTDRLFVVSKAVRERLFPDAAEPPPVVSPHLPSPAPRADGPNARRTGATRLTVFGNVRRTKGQWDAVTALAELSRRGLEAELVLVGHSGREADELQGHAREQGVADRLRLVGMVPDQHPWMAEADVVLVPSYEETFSLVCLEAHLHAKPLVATRVGGILEFVHDGVNGLTVPPGDPQALASAVERLIRQPGLAQRLGEEGRNQAFQRFTADDFSGRVRRMLDEIVSGGGRRPTPAPLLAPLQALAAEVQEARRALDDGRLHLDRVDEERRRGARDLEALQAELRSEKAKRSAAEERVRELTDSHVRISSTRAWRLVQAYWRLAGRLRR